MSIHQLDLFEDYGEVDGAVTGGRRIQGGVKGLITSALTNKGDVSFYFDDAFISRISAGIGDCKISFKYNNRDYMFHGNFSVIIGFKGRKIKFNNSKITGVIDENKEYNTPHFNGLYNSIESQIQIYLFLRLK